MSQEADNVSLKLRSIPGLKFSESGNSSSATIHQDNTQNSKRGDSPTLAQNFPELVQALQLCDWEHLQERFIGEMEERSRVETALQKAAADLLEVYSSIQFGIHLLMLLC